MKSGLATRLYRGEAGLDVIGKRKVWFTVAAVIVLISILSFMFKGFSQGVEFKGGNKFQVPTSVGTMQEVQDAVSAAGAEVVSTQSLGGSSPAYQIRTVELDTQKAAEVKTALAKRFNIDPEQISDNRVSGAWGKQVTERALLGLGIFIVLVMIYLVLRFEWRMAVGAVSSLALDLIFTAGVYSLVGFEVTPSTIIGFLTILGFALYDVVVVFDKVQENTRGITGSSTQTYAEAANLAVNQTLMRSINTGLVALLPVGGLLFIGAGLLKAGTLKDLGLVLFVGMGVAVYSSIFFATPVLVTLKQFEPRIRAHTQRVLARRAAIASGKEVPGVRGAAATRAAKAKSEAGADEEAPETADAALAGAAPKTGARPVAKRPGGSRGGGRGGRPGGGRGGRPGGAKRR
jgi:preprotein translocase subunit SecF